MPTSKRERQRAGREAARAAARAAQRRAQRRRQVITVVAAIAVIAGIGLFISQSGGGSKSASSKSTTTTSVEATTSTGPTTTLAGAVDPTCPAADGSATRTTAFTKAPGMCIDTSKKYQAVVDTDAGSFTIDLDAAKAPLTANNFVFLARYHAYDGVPFHRVIPSFVVQGGDVEKGDGTGGPGYSFADELPKQGDYKVGSVAMANSGANTNGSQFFIITGDQGTALPPQYSLFGQVSAGMDVVKKIEADGSAGGTPTVTHKITKVTVKES